MLFRSLEADAAEDDLAAETAATKATNVTAFERKRPVRKPFPDHLPRDRVVVPAPCSCPACGGMRLSKLGEDAGGDPACLEGHPDRTREVLLP